ncbi:MAG: PAS domain S-box protein [Prolixibacteraceae bacterium]
MNNANPSKAEILRKHAEKLLGGKLPDPGPSSHQDEIKIILGELEKHQVELEQQNQELMLAKEQATAEANKFTDFFDFAPTGFFTLSIKGEILELNLAGAKMLGQERSKLNNNLFHAYVSEESQIVFHLFLAKIFEENLCETIQITLGVNSDLPTYVNLTGKIAGNAELCYITATDVTDNKLAELAIKESAEKFQIFFEKSAVGKSVTTMDGSLQTNDAFCQILGYSREEFKHLKWWDITHPDDISINQKILDSIIAGEKESERWEKRYIHQDGSIVWVDINTAHSSGQSGKTAIFHHLHR